MATRKKTPRRSAEADLDRQQAAAVADTPAKPPRKRKAAVASPEAVGTPTSEAIGPSGQGNPHYTPVQMRAEIKRFIETHGPQWFDALRTDPVRLRSIGMTEDDISPKTIRDLCTELEEEKSTLYAEWCKNNADPDRKLNVVLEGHAELDPNKNAEHPVKGEAHLEKVLKDKKKAETMGRISKLRARKQLVSDYNGPTPESTFSTEETETMATATMKVSESAACKVLAAVGIASDNAPLKKVQARIESLPDMIKESDFSQPESAVEKKLLASILKQLEGGKKVEVGAASNGRVGKNGKAPKAPKAPAKNGKSKRGQVRTTLIKAGTVLTREYKGKECKVTATKEGFKFSGKDWPSLTSIAKHITGATAINGLAFFGVNK